jgi:hypothetical protein
MGFTTKHKALIFNTQLINNKFFERWATNKATVQRFDKTKDEVGGSTLALFSFGSLVQFHFKTISEYLTHNLF